ncbi:lipid-binding SYLF domain-containing protein [Lamprobacter modestohalophilus]|uniref:lipid-binding SYLF domain-containing protein n=1 Tax=Lamprobacter modestohalophilus TaxID=1064514 RepID=UPI002ADEE807|nr:lipid-binding SYLF domain-containing protein [Lamprobacter modestohalophilus]MEA1052088.1 lipid-binding SYLF domain-containing protein [Lamprobacter modestohalophilus]
MSYRIRPLTAMTLSLILTASLLTADGFAAEETKSDEQSSGASATEASSSETTSDALKNAKETVRKAADVVQKIKSDSQASDLLDQAKAIFVVPDYARAALIVGGAGGQGVLVAKQDGDWSAPAFYNIGSVEIGAAAGAEAGEIAFMIMSGDLLESFGERHNFALNSDTGYTVVDDSERTQTSIGKGGDIAVWSETEGLYGDFAASVSDIFWDEDANSAYYGRQVTAAEIINGEVEDPMSPSPLLSAETP